MAEPEYTEPSNEQLAKFLIVYSHQIPGAENLQLSAPILEALMSQNARLREGALRHHRRFQEQINELSKKMMAGELQCQYIRPNGKQCPNYNEPSSSFCGLHKDQESE